jgi:PAS domain S-box-containing protein
VSPLAELFDRQVKARSQAYLFAAGALVGLLTLAFPHEEMVEDLQLAILAGIAGVVAALVYLRAERLAEWELHVALAAGTVILTFANHYAGPAALYPMLYSWIALYAFYFFDIRASLAHVAFIALAYGLLLGLDHHPSPVTRWLLAVGTPTVVGLLISRLLRRLRAEAVQAEAGASELRQSETRTRLVLDSAPDAFITLDSEGLITNWNAAAEHLFGWSMAEAVGQPMRTLILPEDSRDRHDERRRELLEAEGVVSGRMFEVECLRRDGTRFSGEATVSKVEVGGEVFLPGFIRDISERRRRQEEREALLREQAARAEAERIAEILSGMQLLVDAALAHRTLDDIVADLVTRVRAVLGADAASIYLAEDGFLSLGATSGGSRPDTLHPLPFGVGFPGRVAESREPLLANDPTAEELADPALAKLNLDSVIGVPLMAEGEVTGVLVVCATEPRRFAAQDVGLLRLAADRVALGLDHARVYEREHRIAETLQRSLLPNRLPELPGLAVAARYLPAAAEAEVGGDWYDVIRLPGGGVGLVMGDVAGKGLAAASMVGQLRSALRAYALEGHQPAQVVDRLNRLFWAELGESQMATLLYVVLDPADGSVRWVNAGHLPPLLVGVEYPAQFLAGARSVPLGVMPFASFDETSFRLEPGATLVLYTDGLVERPGSNIDDGLARLPRILGQGDAEPSELCDRLLHELVPEGGAPDDVAVLALRNVPMADRFSADFPPQPEALSSMRSLLRRWLRHAAGTEQEIAEITTACGEAATNAIEHAGAGSARAFEVLGRLQGREVDITVRDYGAWRAPRDGDQGRGLSLMEALMDSVEVTPTHEGTSVRLRRTLSVNGSS